MTPTIGIIGGNGRMGRMFANFFKERGVEVLVSDIGTKLTNKDLAEKADIVIVSVPIDITEKIIKEVLPYMPKKSALMDFTSVKEMPLKAMAKGKCEVLGMHPMFGNSNPVVGQTLILCPTKKSEKWAQWMEDFLQEQGVNIIKMTAKQHDKIMNISQGLIHFGEITFADSIRRMKIPVEDLLQYTGKASEMKIQLAARLINQDANLYANIQIQNPHALKSLKEYKKSVDELYKIVKKKDLKAFVKYFEKNKEFYGEYANKAYMESSYLVDQLLAMRKGKESLKQVKPSLKHIAVLGPANTFSDIAATQYLKNSNLKKYFSKDIEEIFELVEKGKVQEGIVPIENKLHGTVRETLDGLFSSNVHITKELNIPIHHALITLAHAKKSDITKIISHTQPLNQCKKYLAKNFPKAEKEGFSSTGAAVDHLLSLNDISIAAIAPEIAANRPELKIIANKIEDSKENSTSFVVIKKGKAGTQGNKTSIAFYFSKNKPGTLFEIFKAFADAQINLSKIESRPTKARFGEYIFYLDFDASILEPQTKKALQSVEKKVAKLKVLGSY